MLQQCMEALERIAKLTLALFADDEARRSYAAGGRGLTFRSRLM